MFSISQNLLMSSPISNGVIRDVVNAFHPSRSDSIILQFLYIPVGFSSSKTIGLIVGLDRCFQMDRLLHVWMRKSSPILLDSMLESCPPSLATYFIGPVKVCIGRAFGPILGRFRTLQ